MSEKVLVAGNNVRNVAQSARKAGYKVYAITKFTRILQFTVRIF